MNNVRIQMRRTDIFGETFLTYYEEQDWWPYLMQMMDTFAACQDTRYLELWMLCREDNDSLDERVCVWVMERKEQA
jgi:hypothetical protein